MAQRGSMNANTHTPGPWRVCDPEWSVIKAAANMHVATVKWLSVGIQGKARQERLGAESVANARLIAAAPELLDFASLIARMKTEDEMGENSPASEDWIATLNELIASARAVVGKAEGKVTP